MKSEISIPDNDKRLVAIYHCDQMQFLAMCDDDDLRKMDYYNEMLTEEQVSGCIEFYNLQKFGITFAECKEGKCLFCKDFAKCQRTRKYKEK